MILAYDFAGRLHSREVAQHAVRLAAHDYGPICHNLSYSERGLQQWAAERSARYGEHAGRQPARWYGLCIGRGVCTSARAQYPIKGTPGWPDPGDLMLQGTPPDTAVVRVHLTTVGEQGWVFLWFGYTTGHRDEGLQLCLETLAGASEASGFVYDSCGAARLPAGTVGAIVTEPGDPIGPGFTIGVTTREVTSVALPPGTGNLTGLVENGRGFPYHVWLMNSPTLGGVPGGPLRAYFLDGYIEFFQTEAGQSTGVVSPVSAWQAPLTVFLIQGNDAGHMFAVGWAPAKAARLVLRLANGKAFAAPTVAGWPGSGLRLWGVSHLPADTLSQRAVVVAYNAKGKVIGQTRPT
jgi:hypothetical protein